MAKQKIVKGKKAIKGQPMTEYGEIKERVQVTLTPTAITSATNAADNLGISRSELIERLLRKGEDWLVDAAKELKKTELSGKMVQYRFYVKWNETEHIVEFDAALTEEEVEEEFIDWRAWAVDSYWARVEE